MSNYEQRNHRLRGSRLPAEHRCRSGRKVGGFLTSSLVIGECVILAVI